jgi:hypothetical protein
MGINKDQQPKEGGTNFEGLEDFVVSVNTEGETPKVEETIEIDTGNSSQEEGNSPDISDEKNDVTKEVNEEGNSGDEGNEGEKDNSTDKPKENQSDSYYGKLASKFLEKGKWQDAEIEKADGTVIKLSELDDIDEETFFAIEESQSKFNQEDIKKNYIKKGDFDENKLKIIEILKEGGDIKDIFETPEEAKRPFENLDLDDEKNQQGVLYNFLTQIQKHDPEDAKVLINNHAKRGTLESKSKEIVEGYQKAYDKKLEDKLEAIREQNKLQQAKDKEFSKKLEEVYGEFHIEPKLAKKFASLGTKRTESGDFELDSVYSEKLEDPKEAAELIYFLVDRESYLKDKMAEVKTNTQKSNLKQIKLLSDKSKKSGKGESVENDNNDFVININE